MRKILFASAAALALSVISAPSFADNNGGGNDTVAKKVTKAATDAKKDIEENKNLKLKDDITKVWANPTPKAYNDKGIPSGKDNAAYVDQVGTGNVNSQTQNGKFSLSVVSQ